MGPQIYNFTLKCFFLTWRRASEKKNLTGTLNWANKFCLKTFLEHAQGGNVFFDFFVCLKLKKNRNSEKRFAHFGDIK